MGKYKRTITGEIDFDGDLIKVTLKPFKRKDMMKILPYLGEPDENGEYKLDATKQAVLIDVAGDLLRKYFISLSGMFIENEPVVVGDNDLFDIIFEDFYFTSFLAEVFELLISDNRVDRKKSDQSQENTSTTLATVESSVTVA